MDFAHLFPNLHSWVHGLPSVWPASFIKTSEWIFPSILAVHLLALAALGGCVLLLNFRLMGVGITSEPASQMERDIRPWLWGAVLVLIATGIAMGMVNAQRLYTRPAFLVKMLSMTAALILSLGVANSAAKHEGQLTLLNKILAGVALIFWLSGIYIFSTTTGPNPGTFHVVCAGWLIAMGFGGKTTRIVLGSITAAGVLLVGVLTYVVFNPIDNYAVVMEIDKWAVRTAALLSLGFIGWEFFGPRARHTITPALARLVGLFTIIAWVTVAAAGRWIGLGG